MNKKHTLFLTGICLFIFVHCSRKTDPPPPTSSTNSNPNSELLQKIRESRDLNRFLSGYLFICDQLVNFYESSTVISQINESHPEFISDTSKLSQGILILQLDSSRYQAGYFYSGRIILTGCKDSTWKMPGSEAQVEFKNVKISLAGRVDYLTLNGQSIIKNYSGGFIRDLNSGLSVIHKTNGTFKVSLSGDTIVNWGISIKRTFKLPSGKLQEIIQGDTLFSSQLFKTILWGPLNKGNSIYLQQIRDITYSSACGFRSPEEGELKYTLNGKDVNIYFGVDSKGNQTDSLHCPIGYKLEWKNSVSELNRDLVTYPY